MPTVTDWTYRDGMWLRDRASVIQEGRAWVACVYGDRFPEDGREVGRYLTPDGAMDACDRKEQAPVSFADALLEGVVIAYVVSLLFESAAKAASRGGR